MAVEASVSKGPPAWPLAVHGVLTFLFGLVAVAMPGMTLVSLLLVFGVFALADGVVALVRAVIGRTGDRFAGIVHGVVGIGVGAVTLARPAVTAALVLFLIAFWALAIGAIRLGSAIALRHEVQSPVLLGVAGVLSIAFGVVALFYPVAGAMSVVWVVGIYAMVFGILMFAASFGRARARRRVEAHASV